MVFLFEMYYIVALGNPGEEYTNTRHNVGFLAADTFVKAHTLPEPRITAQYVGKVSEGGVGDGSVSVLFPETFMNRSGVAVKKFVPPSELANMVVLYDDIALPFGEVKVSFGRGDGGHNGMKSIIGALGSKDFIRVRIGIAPTSFLTGAAKMVSGPDLPKYVLAAFSKSEQAKLSKEILPHVSTVLETIVKEGYVKAMNQYN
jgi:peptidyl-tRNA hydrolase, PTH1 family